MALLTCRRCGLEVEIHGAVLRTRNCPRCQARDAIMAPMALSTGPLSISGAQVDADDRDLRAARPDETQVKLAIDRWNNEGGRIHEDRQIEGGNRHA